MRTDQPAQAEIRVICSSSPTIAARTSRSLSRNSRKRRRSLIVPDPNARLVPIFDELADPSIVARLSAEAEEADWHEVFVWDHVQWREPVVEVAEVRRVICEGPVASSSAAQTVGPRT